ncbi:MAG: hypothetical protein KME13_01625 [Myxacorys californica WJT36-NPBG1]|jgi:hypothetical protein|nr:hypothetical protein [Myxacorys californica WJT36-NPBG1]
MIHRNVISVIGLTLAFLGTASSAQALPGQKIQTVLQWAQKHSLLSPFKRDIGELSGLPFYTSEAKVKGGSIVFAMNPTDQTDIVVGEEAIAYRTQSNRANAAFTRTNTEGLNLIRSIYTQPLANVANDFQQSKYVARVEFNHVDLRFFQGKRFGYTTLEFKEPSQGERFYHFKVIPLKDLNSAILSEQQCRKQSADGCE